MTAAGVSGVQRFYFRAEHVREPFVSAAPTLFGLA